jgi:amidase
MIRERRVTAVEAVAALLSRIEQVNGDLNAVVQLASRRARTEAEKADALLARGEVMGPLHGVPITIKDSLDTAGIVSTGGTTGRREFVPDHDATVVRRLRDAGAIILGKTNTPELTIERGFETDNEVYGRTNNPFDVTRTCGGSSGGAAAIIAAGGSPLDIGSDTGGSIRVPAHCCGITGLRPTSGRVPRTGHIVPYGLGSLDSLTTLGPMARAVEDLALTLPVISGVDWRDPAVVPLPTGNPDEVDCSDLRVAFFIDNGIVAPTAETAAAVKRVIHALGGGGGAPAMVSLIDESRPDAVPRTMEMFGRLWSTYAPGWRAKLLQRAGTPPDAGTSDPDRDDRRPPAVPALADLDEELAAYQAEMLAFIERYDAIVCPVCAFPALPHGGSEQHGSAFAYTMAFNLTGWPVVVVRADTSPEGLPIGVQIVARPWHEHVALALAAQVETVLGEWPRPSI